MGSTGEPSGFFMDQLFYLVEQLKPLIPQPMGSEDKTVEQIEEETRRLTNGIESLNRMCLKVPKLKRKLKVFGKRETLPHLPLMDWLRVKMDLNYLEGLKK